MKKHIWGILDAYSQFVPIFLDNEKKSGFLHTRYIQPVCTLGTYQMQLDYLVQPCKRHNHLHSMLTQKENYNPIICCNVIHSWRICSWPPLSKWFYDTSTGAATGAARCGSFVGGAQIAWGVGYPGIRWTRRFTWFGPPERNTLRPRVNGVVLLYLRARLRSSLLSLSVSLCVCVLPL
jgi:hypothetical protein